MKKTLAILLCVIMLTGVLVGCTSIKGDNKGAEINVYFGSEIYNLDPAVAYTDANAAKVLGLIYEGLMRLDENGNAKKALMKKYKTYTDDRTGDFKMEITLNTSYWSDGTAVSANDFVYAWRDRIIAPKASSPAASMLYCIKNAQQAKLGEAKIDSVGLTAKSTSVILVTFESSDVDIDAFLETLASPALVPVRQSRADVYSDWATSTTNMISNGPFKVKSFKHGSDGLLILERSLYYYRTADDDVALDSTVKPYRINVLFNIPDDSYIIKYDASAESAVDNNGIAVSGDAVTMYNDKQLFYYSDIYTGNGGSVLSQIGTKIKTEDYLSTMCAYFNLDKPVFQNSELRYALSVALDRSYVSSELLGSYYDAATGFVPKKVKDTFGSKTFRYNGGDVLSESAEDAAGILRSAGIDPSKISFTITYKRDNLFDNPSSKSNGYQSRNRAVATYLQETWNALGFDVKIANSWLDPKEYEEAVASGDYDVLIIDAQAASTDPFPFLAQFATQFSGTVRLVTASDPDFDASRGDTQYYLYDTHFTGYSSEEYDALMQKAYEASGKERSQYLHDAEEMLIRDGAVIPIVYNVNVWTSQELSGMETSYFGYHVFTDVTLKNYTDYLETALLPTEKKDTIA
ncbi:MAG: peptide ABC transporter substrate-binding protein [Clostridia bacterium]|nr:peptide ABC transporter substrate-binding protein [Clostridia bacterium]